MIVALTFRYANKLLEPCQALATGILVTHRGLSTECHRLVWGAGSGLTFGEASEIALRQARLHITEIESGKVQPVPPDDLKEIS
jgi:hypothetical protein